MFHTSGSKIMRLEVGMTVFPIVFQYETWRVGPACQIVEIDGDDAVYVAGQFSGRFGITDVCLNEARAEWLAEQRNKHALVAA
jgi:hypothetical protein